MKRKRFRPLGSGKTGRINKGARDREMGGGAVLRQCNACDREKPLGEFPINSAAKRGRRYVCTQCWRPQHAASERRRRSLRTARRERILLARKAAA